MYGYLVKTSLYIPCVCMYGCLIKLPLYMHTYIHACICMYVLPNFYLIQKQREIKLVKLKMFGDALSTSQDTNIH